MVVDSIGSAAQASGAVDDVLGCRRLTVGYPDAPVLTGIDLTVRPGEVVALLGPSGSGKSTLLHTVAGFLPPLAGEIRMAGRAVATARRSVPPEARGHRDGVPELRIVAALSS